jgi:hypothetical protein
MKHVSTLGHLTRFNGKLVTEDVKEFQELPPLLVVALSP